MFKKRENVLEIEEGNLLSPKFDNDGLIPVITMCSKTKDILMHGYMNVEAFKGPNTTFWELQKDNKIIGKVTSAVYSPRLKRNIALAIVEIQQSEIGNKIEVNSNEGKFNCTVVEKPFYDPKKKIASSS